MSNSSHLALKLYSNSMNPVVLPPGQAKLSTKPPPTGSATRTNTIGIVRVTRRNAATPGLPLARMISGLSATNSAAYLRSKSSLFSPQRISSCTSRPAAQPNRCKASSNAASPAKPSRSSEAVFISTAIRRVCSACCARATSGHVAAVAPINVMNSRRRIGVHLTGSCWKIGSHVRFGQKGDIPSFDHFVSCDQ